MIRNEILPIKKGPSAKLSSRIEKKLTSDLILAGMLFWIQFETSKKFFGNQGI